MGSNKQDLRIMTELKKQENERDFFDGFARSEQKARLEGKYPNSHKLTRLLIFKDLFAEVFSKKVLEQDKDGKYLKDEKGKNKYVMVPCSSVESIENIVDSIFTKNLELSISIDGAGRSEFIKTRVNPKQEDDGDKKKQDLIDQLADKIG